VEFTQWWEYPEHVSYRDKIIKRLDRIMANLDALNAAVAALVDDDTSVKAALDDLSAKLAVGQSVSQSDIDAITAKLTGVDGDLKAAVAADDGTSTPTPTPAPAAPAAPPESAQPTTENATPPPLDPDFGNTTPAST
jgi:hypothetical protein